MRLFVAFRPPAAVRATLLAAMGGIAAACWQDDDQLHLTLRFIGDVDRHTAADLVAALAAVRHRSIAARLGAVGTFASRGRPNAVWIGVEPPAALTTLHHKVDQAVIRAGLAADTRAFVPHITLARLGRDAGPVSDFLTRVAPSAAFEVSGFTLFESILTRTAAIYCPIDSFDTSDDHS